MQQFYVVKEVLKEGLRREYEFTVSSKYIGDKVVERLREVAAGAKINGFRKGQVSFELVKRMYSESVISDVLSKVIEGISSEFVKKEGFDTLVSSSVDVVSYPGIEPCESIDLVYKLRLELMPEVPPFNFEGVTLKEMEAEVTQGDVDEFINALEQSYVSFVPSGAGHMVTQGDKVIVDYASMLSGKALRGGGAKGASIVLGRGQFLEDFENQLAGMKKGDEKKFMLKFPPNYKAVHLAGKEVEMSVRLCDVLVPKKVECREELAKGCGFDSVEAMLDFARKSVKEKLDQMSYVLMKKELFDHMDENYCVDLPDYILSQEMERMRQGVSGSSFSGMEEHEVRQEAGRRVKLGMLLMRVSKDRGVAITGQDVLDFVRSHYADYGVSPDVVLRLIKANKDFRDYISGKVLEDKVVKYVIDEVERKKESVTSGDLKALFDSI